MLVVGLVVVLTVDDVVVAWAIGTGVVVVVSESPFG